MKRIIVTGSRKMSFVYQGVAEGALNAAIQHLGLDEEIVLVHGGAEGADTTAAAVWRSWGRPTEMVPANWKKHGRAAGPFRNQEMVNRGADLCIAFPASDSRGTKDCMRRCRRAGIPVVEYPLGRLI